MKDITGPGDSEKHRFWLREIEIERERERERERELTELAHIGVGLADAQSARWAAGWRHREEPML